MRWIDRIDSVNRAVGRLVAWTALAMVLLQFAVVLLRYVFGVSYVWAGEGVMYLHATLFMAGAGYTLLVDSHVRVDIFYARLGPRGQAAVDLFGGLVFLLPSMLMLAWFSWPSVRNSWAVMEGAISVGGIPASFLLKSLIPAFALLLALQGIASIGRAWARLGA